jgi:hypothetical protein
VVQLRKHALHVLEAHEIDSTDAVVWDNPVSETETRRHIRVEWPV